MPITLCRRLDAAQDAGHLHVGLSRKVRIRRYVTVTHGPHQPDAFKHIRLSAGVNDAVCIDIAEWSTGEFVVLRGWSEAPDVLAH
jgi:hypothetical protein